MISLTMLILVGFLGTTPSTQPAVGPADPFQSSCGPICFYLALRLYSEQPVRFDSSRLPWGEQASLLELRDDLVKAGFVGSKCWRFDSVDELVKTAKPAILVLKRGDLRHYVLYVGRSKSGQLLLANYQAMGEVAELSPEALSAEWTREVVVIIKKPPATQPAS